MRRRSWIASANGDTDFPVENLPYGVFDAGQGPRLGIAIGDFVLDVSAVDHGIDPALLDRPVWNDFMAAGPEVWTSLRARLTDLLCDPLEQAAVEPHLLQREGLRLLLPFAVTEYTDFYAGLHHARNVGSLFRDPQNALPRNWLSVPTGYNGRASSVIVSGAPVRRPWGQILEPAADLPAFAPTAGLDFELELGAVVGTPSTGMVDTATAFRMIFGYVLLNDWSARDIQSWEYQPLGPFQAKAAATTISPWIVPRTALDPFRITGPERLRPLLPYLHEAAPYHYDIDLEVVLQPEGGKPAVISRTNARELYYSAAQQLCHHAVCGCAMRTGDLLGSGTVSGPAAGSLGSLLEITRNGAEPLMIDGAARDGFLADGDKVVLRGTASGSQYRIGFGSCEGTVVAAEDPPPAFRAGTQRPIVSMTG